MKKNLLFFLFLYSLCSSNYLKAQDFSNSKWVLSGNSIQAASQFTQDARNDFYRILTYQSMNEKPLTFFGLNFRMAPANFRLDSGELRSDNLNRVLVAFGSGIGSHFFVGMVADAIETLNLFDKKSDPGFKTNISQGLIYGGFYIDNVQLTLGWRSISPQSGVNSMGELVDTRVKGNESTIIELPRQTQLIYSVYINPGIFISYSNYKPILLDALTNSEINGKAKSELQIVVQSPNRFLPMFLGLPFLQLERFTNTPLFQQIESVKEIYLGMLGFDDIRLFPEISGLGFRLAAQYRLTPSPTITYIETSGKWRYNNFVEFGLRSFLKNESGSPHFSTDEYISIGWFNKVRWAFTHSYNSPDRATFLPFSDVHVYGFQVIYGISDIIKPLIPMVRSL